MDFDLITFGNGKRLHSRAVARIQRNTPVDDSLIYAPVRLRGYLDCSRHRFQNRY